MRLGAEARMGRTVFVGTFACTVLYSTMQAAQSWREGGRSGLGMRLLLSAERDPARSRPRLCASGSAVVRG
ncbi:hypothetical protein BDZ91DRAFT_739555 [Kalaharituber pfeilii]|nr:hypothetical protein BDZ91DRAFT_739555 [Kalaharituber pfeilii]